MKAIKMDHEDRNNLLSYYYNEDSKRHRRRMQQHISTCESCKQYLDDLNAIGDVLHQWQDEEPEKGTLDRIMRDISVTRTPTVRTRPRNPLLIAIQTAGAMASVFLVVYMVQHSLTHSHVWNLVRGYWLTGSIGDWGLAAVLFFAFSIFISLALTPIILSETQCGSSTARVRL